MSDILHINSGAESSTDDADIEYEVETILGHRKKHTKGASMEYKIRWKGYDTSYDTWEPEDNLDCKAMLVDYHKNHPKFEEKIKRKQKRKRCVSEVEIVGDAADEVLINDLSVKPLSPMPSDTEDIKDMKKADSRVRVKNKSHTKKKLRKESVDLDSELPPEFQGTPPITNQKKKKISGDIEENHSQKSTKNKQESIEISITESKSPAKKRSRIRVTKKRRETEAEKDLEKNVNSVIPSSTAALRQPESTGTEKIPEMTGLCIGEIKQPLKPTKTNVQKVAPTEVQPGSDSTKENSLPGVNQLQIENQNANTRAVSLTKHKSGFDQGLIPDEIVGATQIDGFKFLLKWKGHSKMEFVDNETAKKKIPLLVIRFYEARIHFDQEDVPLTSPFHPLATGDGNL